MANQKLSQVQIDGVEYDIGLKSLELGTDLHGIQQVADEEDGVVDGRLPFEGKNTYAESLDETLKEDQLYGAVGEFSAAFGGNSSAQGKRSFTNGTATIAKGDDSHAEGNSSVALGDQSHAEGIQTVAKGTAAHSEGLQTRAIGDYSHAEGYDTVAYRNFSTAAGLGTIAFNEAQSVVGRYNAEDSDALFIVGNGEDAEHPSNALSVYPTHSKVGKALSGDQPCLRNIMYGTRSPEVANEVDFDLDESSDLSVTCIDENRPLVSLGSLSGCYNIFYRKLLSECQDLIVIEVEGNSDNILWPIVDQTTVQKASLGPRLFISSASNLVELDLARVSSDTTRIPIPASQATDPADNVLGFETSAISVKNNKIYINPQQLIADMSSIGLDINHYKYLYLQFCNSDEYAPAKEPHTLGSPLVAGEGELYLRIEE